MQSAAIAAIELEEIIGLQQHVVEFDKAQSLFPIKPGLHRLESQHPVDCEMAADVAQEFHVIQFVQPVGIVDHRRIRGPVAVGYVSRKHRADTVGVGMYLLDREHLAHLVLAGRVAYFGCAASHQRNGPMTGFLKPAQQHDLHQIANMERRSRQIIANVACNHALAHLRIKFLKVCAISQKPPGDNLMQEVRFWVEGHCVSVQRLGGLHIERAGGKGKQ